MTEAVVMCNGLRKVFGQGKSETVAVADVSFELSAGASLGIVGESGSGKTTVARMLIGLERPTAGEIRLGEHPMSTRVRTARSRRERARYIQMVFQDPYGSLDPKQSVGGAIGEVLQVHLGLGGEQRRARVAELLAQVGLDEELVAVRPSFLSGGQRQRVAIARALAVGPRVLVLDEAASALDVSIQAQVLMLLAAIRRQTNVALVFISHDLAVVRQVCEEIIVMRRGEVVERGECETVLDSPQHEYTKWLIDSVPRPGWVPVRSETILDSQADRGEPENR